MACRVCKYFTLRTIHTLYEKIAFSLSEIAFPRKIRRIRTVHSAKGEVTVKLTIIYGVVRVRNLWPTSVLHAAVGWLWVVKRRDYPPIRLMGRGEAERKGKVKEYKVNGGRQIKDSSKLCLRTCTWLCTWQCYYRLLVVILVKYCSPTLGRELSKRTSNLPSNNTSTSTTTAFLDTAQPRLPSPHAVA